MSSFRMMTVAEYGADGECITGGGTVVMPAHISEHPTLVALEPDSVSPSSFSSPLDGGLAADDLADPADGEPVLADCDCLNVRLLGLTLQNQRELLSNVSFTAHPGSVTAIIGPSGAGKSTLAKLLGGAVAPTRGVVTFEGYDIHTEYAALRCRIGLVPQDDVVHHRLTVDEALGYAAELRLPNATKEERRRAVDTVLDELELTRHAHTRVDMLSGGQRKRASVAMELLTGPSLLILDEPTSGLDPALDRQVMSMLRRLADAGRVVLVVTHCLTYLDVCDQVLFLAPGGKTAYCGPPSEIACAMGATDWADIFTRVGADPEAAHREFLARRGAGTPSAVLPSRCGLSGIPPAQNRLSQQISTVARRQFRLVAADRCYFQFLTLLPFVLGTLSLVVPGHVGLGVADPRGHAPNEPAQILMLLNISAVFMGMALSIRDLIGERTIFLREQAVGLSASAYLVAKIGVYCAITAVQTAVLTAIVILGKSAPTRGAVVLANPVLELYVTLAATAAVAAITGMALSALAKSQDQILPMLVISVMLSIVFAGGLIPVTDRILLDQLSWAVPARWGFAASASTTDLPGIAPLTSVNEPLWSHEARWWLFDMTMLIALGVVVAAVVRWRLRLNAQCRASAHSARHRSGNRTGMVRAASADRRGEHRRSNGARVPCRPPMGVFTSMPESSVSDAPGRSSAHQYETSTQHQDSSLHRARSAVTEKSDAYARLERRSA